MCHLGCHIDFHLTLTRHQVWMHQKASIKASIYFLRSYPTGMFFNMSTLVSVFCTQVVTCVPVQHLFQVSTLLMFGDYLDREREAQVCSYASFLFPPTNEYIIIKECRTDTSGEGGAGGGGIFVWCLWMNWSSSKTHQKPRRTRQHW